VQEFWDFELTSRYASHIGRRGAQRNTNAPSSCTITIVHSFPESMGQ
jgi:hypothetical protein